MKRPLHQPAPPLHLKRSFLIWGSMILAGLFAYGIGLYQGSRYRIERTVAALSPPLPITSPAEETPTPSTEK